MCNIISKKNKNTDSRKKSFEKNTVDSTLSEMKGVFLSQSVALRGHCKFKSPIESRFGLINCTRCSTNLINRQRDRQCKSPYDTVMHLFLTQPGDAEFIVEEAFRVI